MILNSADLARQRDEARAERDRLAVTLAKVRALADEYENVAKKCDAIVDEFTAEGADRDESPIYENVRDAADLRQQAKRLTDILDSSARGVDGEEAVTKCAGCPKPATGGREWCDLHGADGSLARAEDIARSKDADS